MLLIANPLLFFRFSHHPQLAGDQLDQGTVDLQGITVFKVHLLNCLCFGHRGTNDPHKQVQLVCTDPDVPVVLPSCLREVCKGSTNKTVLARSYLGGGQTDIEVAEREDDHIGHPKPPRLSILGEVPTE